MCPRSRASTEVTGARDPANKNFIITTSLITGQVNYLITLYLFMNSPITSWAGNGALAYLLVLLLRLVFTTTMTMTDSLSTSSAFISEQNPEGPSEYDDILFEVIPFVFHNLRPCSLCLEQSSNDSPEH